MLFFPRLRRQGRGKAPIFQSSPLSEKTSTTIIGDRRFLADVPYLFPKDMPEYGRLTFQHYFLKTLLGRNYVAPLESPKHILDVGCGTGIWGREIAQTFPDSHIVGFDIEPQILISPTLEAPSNCLFVKGDVMQGLPFPDHHFDFTHQRLMVAALPAHT